MIPRHFLIALALLLLAVFAMGFYVLHLRSLAEANQQRAQDQRPVLPPVPGRSESVALFIADDREGALHRRDINTPLPADQGQRAREILRALIVQYLEKESPHPLAPGAEINDVFVVKDAAIIDANAAFADNHRSGIMIEELTLASMAQTLAANMPGIARIKLLVEGKERETLAGHADTLTFYETALALQFVQP